MSAPPAAVDGATSPWRNERFAPLGLLGRGSFGSVYLAHDTVRGQRVALKLLRGWDPAEVVTLRKEFRALKDVEHPNVVALFDLFADDRDGFFTMEVVEGTDIVTHVGEAATPSERWARARRCLAQLVEGVAALHARGTLHRDLKPSNVTVRPDGRLVVLDAGLSKSIDQQHSSQRYVCGTPEYMSPEQALGQLLDEASDWYAVGVMAYELFAGARPFANSPMGALHAKVLLSPPSLAELCPGLPPDDVAIVDGLVAREPGLRPDLAALRRWLAADRPEHAAPFPVEGAPSPRFVGREMELQRLEGALDEAHTGRAVVVTVVGESGMGKTALLQAWLERHAGDVQLLAGRCYQREMVLFSGFEDVFDQVAERAREVALDHVLAGEERAVVEFVIGRRLSRTDDPASASTVDARVAAPGDPLNRRRLVGRAFAKVVAHLVRDAPVVLWLDDVQWAGADTGLLVVDLARAEWPCGCLIVLTHRPLGPGDGASLATIQGSIEVGASVELGPLTSSDATLLVERASRHGATAELDNIVAEAAGHPLLLVEAARHFGRDGDTGGVSLADILASRVARLPADARRVLAALSVAGEPLAEATAQAAAGLDAGSPAARILVATGLARRAGRWGQCLVPFHDELRATVVARLSVGETRAMNLAVAEALERSAQGEPESLFAYFLAAGERRRAADLVSAAARRLGRALAFDRAASLYRRCLELAGELSDEETQSVRLALADALVHSGRTEEGARVRLEAAARAGAADREQLVAQAARELIRAGRVDEGLDLARATFSRLGLRLSRSGRRALPSILFDRALLRLRGRRHEPTPAARVPRLLLDRIDWCQSLALVLPVIETLRAFQVHNQGLRWSLRAGEPGRLGQSLAMEAGFRMALAGGRDDGEATAMLQTARILAQASGDPRAVGVVEIVVGSTRWSVGDWAGCVRHIDAGIETLRRCCRDVSWEVNFARTHSLDALSWMGELQAARRIIGEELDDAKARGDLYAQTMYTLRDLPTVRMIEDLPDEARSCSRALASWTNRGFQVEHMVDVYKQTEVDLYLGLGAQASARVEGRWRDLSRSQLMRLQPFRIELVALRGRAALAAARQARGPERERLVALAARLGSTLEREPASIRGVVFGAPVLAGVALARDDREGALRRLDAAIAAAAESGMRLHEQVLRHRRGELVGSAEPAAAETWMRSAGVRRPERYLEVLFPSVA